MKTIFIKWNMIFYNNYKNSILGIYYFTGSQTKMWSRIDSIRDLREGAGFLWINKGIRMYDIRKVAIEVPEEFLDIFSDIEKFTPPINIPMPF